MGVPKDWTGQKYHRLTFIRPTKERRGHAIVWEALCECGNITFIVPYKVVSGHTKSCGCYNKELLRPGHHILDDLTGQTFEDLTFIGRKIKDGKMVWEIECICGNIIYEQHSSPIKLGKKKSCGCRSSHRSMFLPRIRSAKCVWQHTYRDCDFEVFLELSQRNCYYCGIQPYQVYNAYEIQRDYSVEYAEARKKSGDFIYNGLDRVDNTRGHSPDNVVPCCAPCNVMKNDMTLNGFLSHIARIYKHATNIKE